MGCNGSCSSCNSNDYMSDDSLQQFNSWYTDIWNAMFPDQRATDKNIKNITVVTNEDCNFACTYCYQTCKTSNRLTKDTAKKIVDFILDDDKLNGYASSKESQCVILDFIGGEPLLNIEVIDYLVDYFKFQATIKDHPWALNHMISMSSNGSLYSQPKVQEFLKKNERHVSLGISVDGTKELHDSCRVYHNGKGTYDDVMRNVELWKQNRGSVTTKLTIAPENLPYLSEAILHLFNEGFDTVAANVVFEDVWNIDLARDFYKQLKHLADEIIDNKMYKNHFTTLFSETIGAPMLEENNNNWCGGDGSMLAFGPDGTIYPCLRYMSYSLSSGREPLIIGHVNTEIEPKEQSKVIQDLTSITRKSQSAEKCFYCPIAGGCAWCSGLNYDMFGTVNKRTTYHCDTHKARVLAGRYFWQRIYNELNLDKEYSFTIPKEWALEIVSEEEYNMLLNLSNKENKNMDLKEK